MRKLLLLKSNIIFLLVAASIFSGCKKDMFHKPENHDIEDCDNFSDYYEDGEHYIRRDLVTDEGVIDRKKVFQESDQKNSRCFPTKTFGRLKK